MKRILASYLWWTEERGSFHYDVMVTLILAFIFVTPHLWDYHDRPASDGVSGKQMLVKAESPNSFIYEIDAPEVSGADDLRAALERNIQAVSGSVTIVKYEALKDSSGKVAAYKVWAHR